MPLFFQQVIDGSTQLAIWKIEEEEAFFTRHVPLQRTITHPHKRLQHLAGRYLLTYLFPDFPLALIQIADTRKPFLEDEAYHFSISHCGDYAGVIVSKDRRVGIDIELVNDKIERIQHKFVGDEEWNRVSREWMGVRSEEVGDRSSTLKVESQGAELYSNKSIINVKLPENKIHYSPFTIHNAISLLTLIWSCKEAVFKWYGIGEVGFIRHMEMKHIVTKEEGYKMSLLFKKNEDLLVDLHSRFFDNLVMSYVLT